MKTCFMCPAELTAKNSSNEHIILNAMGGKLKSKALLCNACNSKIGHEVDSELAKQFEFLSAYLQVKRDSGSIPVIRGGKTKDGTEINLLNGSTPSYPRPTYEVKNINGGVQYHLVANNEIQMRQLLAKAQKEHPYIDIDEAMSKAKFKQEKLKEPIIYNQTYGGEIAFRSIAKTAVNYFIHTKGNKIQIQHLLEYLKGNVKLDIVKHFHPKSPAYKKDAGEIIHLLHLVGDKHKKLLYCFVEFFSTHSYLVILSDNYEGKNISHTYAYNLLTHKEVFKEVDLKLKKENILEMETSFSDFPQVGEKTERLMKIAHKIHSDREISRIIENVIQSTFGKYAGQKITKEMISEFSEEMALQYVRFAFGE